MKKSLSMIAAAALLGTTAMAPVAFAQEAAPATPGTEAPATMEPATPGTTTAPDATTAAPMASTDAASDTYLTEQSVTQISANEFIGTSVYAGDDSIGSISDLIIEDNGNVVAAVIGVGGFLGIGQKNVAIPMSKITATQDENGDNLRLTTVETTETLNAAPEYTTLAEQPNADAATTDTMAPDATAPAPATTTTP